MTDREIELIHGVANGGIALAYFLIPAIMWRQLRSLQWLPSAHIGTLFMAFILSCGVGHLFHIRMPMAEPWQTLSTFIDVGTAVLSLTTARVLWALYRGDARG